MDDTFPLGRDAAAERAAAELYRQLEYERQLALAAAIRQAAESELQQVRGVRDAYATELHRLRDAVGAWQERNQYENAVLDDDRRRAAEAREKVDQEIARLQAETAQIEAETRRRLAGLL